MSKFSRAFVNFFSRLLARLPIGLQLFCGDLIGVLWFDVLRIRRRVALENLRLAFPDWDERKRVRVARASVQNIGRTLIEFLRIPALSHPVLRARYTAQFKLRGVENLERALARGKGVFLLTAHIGNGDWATVGLALSGHPIFVVSKEFKWAPLNRFWFETRASLGTQFLPDRGSSLSILRELKRNHAIAFMLDQFLGPPIGIKTKFFGRETGTGMGLALLTGRAAAAVVPTYTFREADGSTVVVFDPEIPFVESVNKEDTILQMTQKYCDHIEGWVRAYPEQWMWVHRRWKRFKY